MLCNCSDHQDTIQPSKELSSRFSRLVLLDCIHHIANTWILIPVSVAENSLDHLGDKSWSTDSKLSSILTGSIQCKSSITSLSSLMLLLHAYAQRGRRPTDAQSILNITATITPAWRRRRELMETMYFKMKSRATTSYKNKNHATLEKQKNKNNNTSGSICFWRTSAPLWRQILFGLAKYMKGYYAKTRTAVTVWNHMAINCGQADDNPEA